MTRPSTGKLLAAFATVYVVWGSTYYAIRLAIDTMPPLAMASVRFLVAGLLMYGWLAVRRGHLPRPGRREWINGAIVGILLLAVANGGVTLGERTVPSGIAALEVATVPLWMVVMAHFALRERLSRLGVVGVLVGLTGVALLLRPGAVAAPPTAVAALLLSPFFWAMGSIYSRRQPAQDPLIATAIQMLTGGAALGIASLATGDAFHINLAALTLPSLAGLIYLILAGSILAFTAYLWLLRNVPARAVSTYAYVNPVVAVLLGWALLGEPLTLPTVVAGAVILVAVGLILSAGRGRQQVAPTSPDLRGLAPATRSGSPSE